MVCLVPLDLPTTGLDTCGVWVAHPSNRPHQMVASRCTPSDVVFGTSGQYTQYHSMSGPTSTVPTTGAVHVCTGSDVVFGTSRWYHHPRDTLAWVGSGLLLLSRVPTGCVVCTHRDARVLLDSTHPTKHTVVYTVDAGG